MADVEQARAANGAFNGVTARLRPGSTLKPFVYGAAFERGDTPATLAYDVVLPEGLCRAHAPARRHRHRAPQAARRRPLDARPPGQRVRLGPRDRPRRDAPHRSHRRVLDYTAVAARFGDPTEPRRPDTIVAAEICPVSGKRPGPSCEHHKREVFMAGHVPRRRATAPARLRRPRLIGVNFPTPGTHRVAVARGAATDAITIIYE
jgi:hypothetical protein